MGRAFICLGALTAALLAAAPEARAKMVYYEINGQRYSYSTNNRAQVKEARQRIDAANAAEAAKAKAQAERSANPLARSQTAATNGTEDPSRSGAATGCFMSSLLWLSSEGTDHFRELDRSCAARPSPQAA